MDIYGKKINFLGDSITEGSGVQLVENRYDNRLKAKYGLRTNNYGIGGTRLAHQTKPSEKPRYDLCMCGRAFNIDPSADITVVYGGVNDYLHGDAPFGEWGDKTPATFVGAVYFIMNFLKTNDPEQALAFMTPARCYFYGVECTVPSPHLNKRPDARPLLDYVQVIVRTGKELGIPVLNLYDDLGVDSMREDDRVRYTVEGLHFNDEGHARIAERLADFLSSL